MTCQRPTIFHSKLQSSRHWNLHSSESEEHPHGGGRSQPRLECGATQLCEALANQRTAERGG